MNAKIEPATANRSSAPDRVGVIALLVGAAIIAWSGILVRFLDEGLTSVAVGRASVGLVALVILAQPPFSALFAWGSLGEVMTALQMTGGAIILASVLLSRPATATPTILVPPNETARR